jgi:hypothetical protein
MIEAGFAESVTSRRNKKDDRAETPFALGGAKQLNELDGFVGQNILLWESQRFPVSLRWSVG